MSFRQTIEVRLTSDIQHATIYNACAPRFVCALHIHCRWQHSATLGNDQSNISGCLQTHTWRQCFSAHAVGGLGSLLVSHMVLCITTINNEPTTLLHQIRHLLRARYLHVMIGCLSSAGCLYTWKMSVSYETACLEEQARKQSDTVHYRH